MARPVSSRARVESARSLQRAARAHAPMHSALLTVPLLLTCGSLWLQAERGGTCVFIIRQPMVSAILFPQALRPECV